MTGTILEATGLSKRFATGTNLFGRPTGWHHAVSNVDLRVARGETLALVGESGAGKSTVGRMVLRLIEPDEGRVDLDGTDVLALGAKQLRALRKRMQMIFQDPFSSLDPLMVVEEAVGEPLAVHFGLKGDERRKRVLELLDRVGIGEHQAERYPYEFSGGQLQRIAIARALAVEPDLIVCDEPVAALDVSIRAQVVNLLDDLQQERGVAYVFISHDLSLVRKIADRVAVMYQGQIVEEGETEALFTAPQHPYTRALLKVIPVPDPRRRKQRSAAGAAGRRAAGSGSGTEAVAAAGDEAGAAAVARRRGAAEEERESAGCPYAPRCTEAVDRCWTEPPVLRVLERGSKASCHLAEGSSAPAETVPAGSA